MRNSLFITVLFCCLCNMGFAQLEAKYELKSAIITKEATALGQTMEMEWYIDDYGRKEAVFTTVSLPPAMGGDRELMVITEGTQTTTIELDTKIAHKTTLPEAPINFLSITPETMQAYDLREEGQENILGRPCRIFYAKRSEMGMEVDLKLWVWKGLPLKTEASAGGMAVYMEIATNIRENVTIPADKLTPPPGVQGL